MLGETEAWEVDRDLCKVIHQYPDKIHALFTYLVVKTSMLKQLWKMLLFSMQSIINYIFVTRLARVALWFMHHIYEPSSGKSEVKNRAAIMKNWK